MITVEECKGKRNLPVYDYLMRLSYSSETEVSRDRERRNIRIIRKRISPGKRIRGPEKAPEKHGPDETDKKNAYFREETRPAGLG